MDMIDVFDALDELADMRAKRDELAEPYQREIDLLSLGLRDATNDISDEIAGVETAIKAAVTKMETSAKGKSLQAVYSKPRITWDTKALDGYAKANPDVLAFRKEGKPSVSIREVK